MLPMTEIQERPTTTPLVSLTEGSAELTDAGRRVLAGAQPGTRRVDTLTR